MKDCVRAPYVYRETRARSVQNRFIDHYKFILIPITSVQRFVDTSESSFLVL